MFSFENYSSEDHMKTRGKHEGVLSFLYEVIKDVKFRADQPRDPLKEIKERRQFVLNYIHETAKKEERRKEEKAKALEKALLEKTLKQREEEMKRLRLREQRQQDEELKRQHREMEHQRQRDLERQEEEVRIRRESLGKNKPKILRFFKQKKNVH